MLETTIMAAIYNTFPITTPFQLPLKALERRRSRISHFRHIGLMAKLIHLDWSMHN